MNVIRRWNRIVLWSCITVILLACDLAALGPGAGSPSPTAPPQAGILSPTQSAAGQVQPAVGTAPTQGAPAPTAVSGRDTPFGRVADASELTGYRARILMELRKADGSKPESTKMTTEWVKSPSSLHTTLGEGDKAIEVIKIADRSWIKMGTGWIETPPGQQNAAGTMPDNYLPEQNVQVQTLGDDTVNGVRCRRQSYSGKVTITIPAIQNRAETKLSLDVKGEMCIANQAGLPPVVVREKSEMAGNLFGALFQAALGSATQSTAGETTYVERELYDVNTAIAINPPQESTSLAGGPTPKATRVSVPTAAASPPIKTTATKTRTPTRPAGTAVKSPTATRQPTASSAGTTLFRDDFSATALGTKWTWQDRWDDAHYDLAARPGFLRMVVPTSNDLSPWTNFDGPYLLQPVDGGWTMTTAVEFVPVQQFQGAGLLVYVDDDHLVRLERAAGGTGIENGVHLSVIRDGEFETAAAVEEIPAAIKRIELRLQRQGNRFTASWREAGKTWQSVGTTEIELATTVQVGIAALCEFDAPDVTADFDSFDISRP